MTNLKEEEEEEEASQVCNQQAAKEQGVRIRMRQTNSFRIDYDINVTRATANARDNPKKEETKKHNTK